MKFAYFPGCKIPFHLPQHGASVQASCAVLNIELVEIPFVCCGYPVRDQSLEASYLSAAENFALAGEKGLGIMTPCKCCFGNLQHAKYRLRHTPALQKSVEEHLARRGMELRLDVPVSHLLTVLQRDVGPEALRTAVTRPLTGVRAAAHYGCHALRPGNITRFDNPLAPTIFETLLQAIGAEPVSWPLRLECCGNPLWGKSDVTARRLAGVKLADAAASGADVLATACTYCQIQFDSLRETTADREVRRDAPPAVLFPQLLGLSLGLEPAVLGLEDNITDPGIALKAAGRL